MDIYETRRENFRHLLETQCAGQPAIMGRRIGKEPSYVHRLLYPHGHPNARNISDSLLDAIYKAFPDLPRGWMDDPEAPRLPKRHIDLHETNLIVQELEADIAEQLHAKEALTEQSYLMEPLLPELTHRPVSAEHARLIRDFDSLPAGWQHYLLHKAAQLRRVADTLPAFLKSSLQAIPPESNYWEWERSLDEYLHQQNGHAK